jgi:hypothetical protein
MPCHRRLAARQELPPLEAALDAATRTAEAIDGGASLHSRAPALPGVLHGFRWNSPGAAMKARLRHDSVRGVSAALERPAPYFRPGGDALHSLGDGPPRRRGRSSRHGWRFSTAVPAGMKATGCVTDAPAGALADFPAW